MAGFLWCEPTERTHQLMSKINTVIMLVWWPVVWYGAMLPNKEFAPMDFSTYFWSMSAGETAMGIVYAYCGWFILTEQKEKVR